LLWFVRVVAGFLHGCLFFVLFWVVFGFSFVNISQVIGWEGWVFCASQQTVSKMTYVVEWDVKPYATQLKTTEVSSTEQQNW